MSKPSDAALLPCPFCGSHRVARQGRCIECFDCRASGPERTQRDECEREWNRRARDSANVVAIEAATTKAVHAVMAQREEVLRAFVAKYGFEPDEAMQVSTPNGWYITRRQTTPPAQAAEAVLDTARLNWLASLPMAVEFDYDQPGPGVLISFSAPAGTRASLNLRATCDAAIAAMQAGE